MRTDVKIGIAVGLFVAVVAVLYFLLPAGSSSDEADQGEIAGGPAQNEPARPGRIGTDLPTPQPAAEPNEPEAIVPRIVRLDLPELAPAEEPVLVRPALAEEQTPPAVSPIVVPVEVVTVDVVEQPTPVAPVLTPVRPVESPPAGQRTYVVKTGDAGFWGIAEKMYGHGKHWPLIANANPGVEHNRLQVGQKLVIPPLPAARPTAGVSRTPVAPTGRAGRTYKVRAGDAGFWGIAKSQYGDGKYWTLIQKANPDANPSKLQVGQVLVIPPLPSRASPAAAPAATPTAAAGGGKTYTVKAGDAGFWGIAKSQYGDGKYWTLIEKANPNVDPSRLRVGQELIIPELSEQARTVRTSPARDAADSAESGSGGDYVRPPSMDLSN